MSVTLHPLHRDDAGTVASGDFGVHLVGDAVHIGPVLHDVLMARGLRTVEEFVSYVQAFREEFAAALGWTEPQVTHAFATMHAQLRGVVDAEILDPPAYSEPYFGALIPANRSDDS